MSGCNAMCDVCGVYPHVDVASDQRVCVCAIACIYGALCYMYIFFARPLYARIFLQDHAPCWPECACTRACIACKHIMNA